MHSETVTVSTFYSFVTLDAPQHLRAPILERMRALGIRGTITLAGEGINATVSGAGEAIEALMEFLKTQFAFTTPTFRESYFSAQPFKRSKVKVKRELISIGVPTFPAQCVGHYVAPADWNALITAPDVVTIDTRNDYEFTIGHFAGAVNPATRNFKQMVAWTQAHLLPELLASQRGECAAPRIAMYCTGGIRCEKYSSYLVALGFPHVYHLHGGILAYLEQVPPAQSLWRGGCFVFDERTSVGHGLLPVPAMPLAA
ncbi:MAG: rhodanese domain-containing protein [Alphaproteobacteria bacterium]|nr:rhodanese domain-containing protein [Alphaproteobacteria bacterium]